MVDKLSTGVTVASSGEAELPSWPGWMIVSMVLAASIYSFSPRSIPDFPASGLKSDRVLINDVINDGSRLIAVGEQGNILYADSARGPWKQASIEPHRGSTLTRVTTAGEGIMLAVGHDSWILRSQDRGQSWKEISFDGDKSEPLLGIAGPYDGTLYAFGAFGQFKTSKDRGVSWQKQALVEEGGKAAAAPAAFDPNDIFAGASDLGGGIAESHLNAMTRAGDGSLILVGERGMVARSTNGGLSWKVVPEFYRGSFYGVLAMPSGRLLVYGMRGNTFYSDDAGKSWKASKMPIANSLFDGTVLRGGEIILVGASNTMLMSRDKGTSFVQISKKGPHGLAAVLAFENGELLKVGEGGMALVRLGPDGTQDEGQASEPVSGE